MEIRTRIRNIREKKGLRARDVAQKVGISRPFYTLLENGNRRLTADLVRKIARALDVSVAQLFGEPAPPPGTPLTLQPGDLPALRAHLRPLLGNQTNEAVDAMITWLNTAEEDRQVPEEDEEKAEQGWG
ncbi:MAG: helix-turn-helix transcriptional regulator [bacterium]|nr:helix-turn-helix transcriptional regulator [bacterium]